MVIYVVMKSMTLVSVIFLLQLACTEAGNIAVVVNPVFRQEEFEIAVVDTVAKLKNVDVTLIYLQLNNESSTHLPQNKNVKSLHFEIDVGDHLEVFRSELRDGQIAHDREAESRKKLLVKLCHELLDRPDFIKLFADENFYAVFHNADDHCTNAIAQKMGIKKIVLLEDTLPSRETVRASIAPRLPHNFRHRTLVMPSNPRFLDRFLIFFEDACDIINTYPTIFHSVNRKFDGHAIKIIKADQVIISSDEFLHPVYAPTHTAHYIQPLTTTADLPTDLEDFMKSSSNLVVVSLGRNKYSQSWVSVLSSVISKNRDISFVLDTSTDFEKAENVAKTELAGAIRRKVYESASLVVSTGDHDVLRDALHSGVPSLVVPVSYQEAYFAEQLTRRGLAHTMSALNFTVDEVNRRINNCLSDKKLRSNADSANKTPNRAHLVVQTIAVELFRNNVEIPVASIFVFDLVVILVSIFSLLLAFKTLAKWYYWSCCEMSYKEKVKYQ